MALPWSGSNLGSGAPDLEVALLDDLLGLRRVADHPQREPEGPRGGGVVEGGKGLVVATGGLREQVSQLGASDRAQGNRSREAGRRELHGGRDAVQGLDRTHQPMVPSTHHEDVGTRQ